MFKTYQLCIIFKSQQVTYCNACRGTDNTDWCPYFLYHPDNVVRRIVRQCYNDMMLE